MVATIVYPEQRHCHEASSLLPTAKISDNDICHGEEVEVNRQRDRHAQSKAVFAGAAVLLVCLAAIVAVIASRDGHLKSSGESPSSLRHDGNNHQNRSGSIVTHEGITDSESQCFWPSPNVETTETVLPGEIPKPMLHDNNTRQLRWGILGLGRIANDFTTALKMAGADVRAAAAGSLPNTTARAKAFAKRYSIPKSYGSYEDMAADPNVDIVYIATINSLHLDPTLMMLKAGKNVLLEKPMAMNVEEAEQMAQAAKDNQRLLLTNFWTRFFPVTKYIQTVLASQRLGKAVAMRGDFGLVASRDPEDRFLNRTQGGGAVLDLGCYLINLAVMANPSRNLPVEVQASAQRTYFGIDYKVDTESSFILKWNSQDTAEDGAMSESTMIMSGQASFRHPSSFEVEIEGNDGRLKIHGPANAPNRTTIYEYRSEGIGTLKHVELVGSKMPKFDERYGIGEYPRGEGFVYVINELEQCMFEKGIPGSKNHYDRPGCLELETLPMAEQLDTVRITEEVLRKIGYWDWQ